VLNKCADRKAPQGARSRSDARTTMTIRRTKKTQVRERLLVAIRVMAQAKADFIPNRARQRAGAANGNQPAVWTVLEDDALYVLRGVRGLSTKTIAEKISRSQGVVTRRCRELGIKAPPPPPKPPVVQKPDAPPQPRPAGLITLATLSSLLEPIYVMRGH
jgi:hypothetical protein